MAVYWEGGAALTASCRGLCSRQDQYSCWYLLLSAVLLVCLGLCVCNLVLFLGLSIIYQKTFKGEKFRQFWGFVITYLWKWACSTSEHTQNISSRKSHFLLIHESFLSRSLPLYSICNLVQWLVTPHAKRKNGLVAAACACGSILRTVL